MLHLVTPHVCDDDGCRYQLQVLLRLELEALECDGEKTEAADRDGVVQEVRTTSRDTRPWATSRRSHAALLHVTHTGFMCQFI